MRQFEYFPTLDMALNESMRVDELKKLISLTGITPKSNRKADLVDGVKKYLDGNRLRELWNKLDRLQQAALSEVVHSEANYHNGRQFYAKYGEYPNWGTVDKWGSITAPSELCFFFYQMIMPDDMRARLREFVPRPGKANIKTLKEIPEMFENPYQKNNWETREDETHFDTIPLTVHETELTAQRELLSVLRLADAGKINVSPKTHRPSAAAIKRVRSVLEGVDFYPVLPVKNKWSDENSGPIRAFAWPLLLQAGGLVQCTGNKLQLTTAGRKALSRQPAETIRTLWKKWTKTTLLDELSRIDPIKGQKGKAKRALTALSSRRKALCEALSECPTGAWFLTNDFYTYITALDISYLVTRDPRGLYIAEQQYGSLGYEGGIKLIELRYLYCFLLEYAATLGLIDVALTPPAGARQDFYSMWGSDDLMFLSRYDGLILLRITNLGAYCLGKTNTIKAKPLPHKSVLHVQPNMEIVASETELTASDKLALDTFALKTSDFTWRLEQKKLLNCVEQGRSISEIREFLVAKSKNDLPDTVIHFFKDSAEKCSQLKEQGLAQLIECADPALALLIVNDTQAGKYCLLAGDRNLVVPVSKEAKFKKALKKIGYIIAPKN
ncbi:helicase-associated domain-containing protein [candidate division CSSED10-310 bacterium]|uniref:Helicase-associated domain-containing protein n=1 Tax=candidate division CSSED10-310 bacterium TaxID=2855610 RepID=A0ABV6YV94_UNCC1